MNVIPHPDFVQLNNDCEVLQEELLSLIVDIDALESTIIPNIEAEYQLAIGHLEYKQFCVQVEINKLKRTIEIIQASVNHGKMISQEKINEILKKEFKAWEDNLKEHLERIELAKTRKQFLLSLEESKEIQKLYRKIAKKIHPDINPDMYHQHVILWKRAVEAYKNGILDTLKALWVLVQDFHDEMPQIFSGLEDLNQKKEELKDSIAKLLSRIHDIKSNHPYTLKEKLMNRSWVKEQKTTLEKSIKDLSFRKIQLKMIVDQMFKEN